MPETALPGIRLAHLTTVDMSLALLLSTELEVDVATGATVFGLSAPGPYVERVEALGVTHVPLPSLTRSWDLLADARAFVELVGTLRDLHLDVLHTHTPKAGVMGRIAGRLARVPVLVNTCHGLWARPDDPLAKRVLVYGSEGLAAQFSDYELFQNAEDSRTLRRFLKPGRSRVVGNGVDLERFKPDPEGRARIRAEWGVADDELVVGTIGRRVHEKGLAEFAEAAHALGDQATFVWVGPADDTDADARVPHEYAVRFVGELTDMTAVYSALDIFVLASYREGFSRASMEAAACGLPMVLTDIRGCREVGTHEEHLLLTPARDAEGLADSVGRLLRDSDLRGQLGEAARRRAMTHFDQRRVANTSLEVYAQVLRGKRRRNSRHNRGKARTQILHVLPQDLNRGAQAYAGQLRDALRDDPNQEHLVVTLFDGPEGAARPDVELCVPDSPARKVLDPRALAKLRKLIATRRPGVVVAHGGESLKYVIPAAQGTPTVYYKVGLSSAEISRASRTRLYGALARRANRVVGVSSEITHQVAELFGVPRESLVVIPNGREPSAFYPASPGEPTRARPLLLWVGQLEPGKRPGLFLEAVRDLRGRGLEFDAVIVGDGQMRGSLEKQAAETGVSLLGTRTDVPDLLRSATVLVLTSAPDTEGMPGVLLEAGLSGLPVVSTPAAGVRDVIVHGETGFLEDSVTQIGDRLAELLSDAPQRLRMGAQARGRCQEHFSIKSTAQQWRDVINSLQSDRSADLATKRTVT